MWDDQCIVFNTASGQTHLLDPLPALIVRRIAEGCSDSETLFQQIAEELDLDLSTEVLSTLRHTVGQLDDLGLIEPTLP